MTDRSYQVIDRSYRFRVVSALGRFGWVVLANFGGGSFRPW